MKFQNFSRQLPGGALYTKHYSLHIKKGNYYTNITNVKNGRLLSENFIVLEQVKEKGSLSFNKLR